MSEPNTIETSDIRIAGMIEDDPRCSGTFRGRPCNAKLLERAPPGTVARCPRCKTVNRW